MEEVARFALLQSHSVHATRPALVIVANLQRKAEKTMSETTSDFFSTHDPDRHLYNYYSDVRVVRLPDADHRKAAKAFETRMGELIECIEDMMKARIAERRRLGIDYSERMWLKVFHILISDYFEKLDKGIRMGEVISLATLPKDYVRKALKFFSAAKTHRTVADVDEGAHEAFFVARTLTIQMLAAIEAANVVEWRGSQLGKLVSSPVQKGELEKQARKDLEV